MRAILARAATAAFTGTVCLFVLGYSASSAYGGAIVGFEINSISSDPLFLFENQGTDTITDDTLKTNDPVTVDLTIDLSDLGREQVTFEDALFEFDSTLTTMNSGPLGAMTAYELLFNGTFHFEDPVLGNIFTVNFDDARMLLLGIGGTIAYATGVGANEGVTYIPGEALPGVSFLGPQEFDFTVTDLQDSTKGPVDIRNIPPRDDIQVEDFTFNSSFSGISGAIPEPSTLALTTLAALALLRRRTM